MLTTTPSDVYVAPSQFVGEVESMLITNTTNTNADVTVEWYDNVTAQWYTILHLRPIAGYGYFQLENFLFLSRGSKIRAVVNAHGAVTVTLKIKEHFTQNNV